LNYHRAGGPTTGPCAYLARIEKKEPDHEHQIGFVLAIGKKIDAISVDLNLNSPINQTCIT
jgi:hypothetical protein